MCVAEIAFNMSNLPLSVFQVKHILIIHLLGCLNMEQQMTEKVMTKSVPSRNASKKAFKPGIKEISLMLAFQALQNTLPKLASLMAYHLWFHPGRKSIKLMPDFRPQDSIASKFKINGKTVCYWRAGSGPAVLLVHGWASCGKQMAKLAQSILNESYSVIWFDAPAHGESTGWQTSLFEFSQSICEIQQREGEFEVVLAHSFGVPCSLYAIQNGLKVKKVIAIASPSTASSLIDRFCKIIKANSRIHELLTQRIEKFIGELSIEDIGALNMAHDIDQPSLVIHDKHDRMIRSREGRALQKNLKNSAFLETERLGHNRILNDPQVIKQCIEFIQVG